MISVEMSDENTIDAFEGEAMLEKSQLGTFSTVNHPQSACVVSDNVARNIS